MAGQHPVPPFAWKHLDPFLGRNEERVADLFSRWAVLYVLHGLHIPGTHPADCLRELPEGLKQTLLLSESPVQLCLHLEAIIPQLKGGFDYDLLWEDLLSWHRKETRRTWARKLHR